MIQGDQRLSGDPAEQAAHMLFRVGFGIIVILLPLSAILSRRAPLVIGPVGAIVLILAVLLTRDASKIILKLRPIFARPTTMIVLGLTLWAILSLLWSPYTASAVERIFRIVGTAALTLGAVLTLPEKMRTSNLYLIATGVGLGIIVIALQALSILGTTDPVAVERGTIFTALLAWPAVAHLALKKRSLEAMAIAASIGAIVIFLRGPVMLPALLVGSVILGGAINNRQAAAAALIAGIVVLIMGAPLWALLLSNFPMQSSGSGLGSLGINAVGKLFPIWADVIGKDPIRLMTGHGIDTALRNIISPLLEGAAPKSLLFEIWYELGLLGALGLTLFLAISVNSLSKLPHGVSAFALGAFGFGFTLAVMGLGTSQTWWLTALSMTIIAFAGVANREYVFERPKAQFMPSTNI